MWACKEIIKVFQREQEGVIGSIRIVKLSQECKNSRRYIVLDILIRQQRENLVKKLD